MEETDITLEFLLEQSPLSITQIMELVQMKRFTWYSRMKQPEKFTVEEIEKIAEVLVNVARLYNLPTSVTPSLIFAAIRNQIKQTKPNQIN